MPLQTGKDEKGHYARWGDSGKKYYFNPDNKTSRSTAKKKAMEQGSAIHASKTRRKQRKRKK